MAVAFRFTSDSIGEPEYDALLEAIGRKTVDAPVPDGMIAHFAGPTPMGGWDVIDVWESEDAANRFYGSDDFAPVMAAARSSGIQTTPWTLHRIEVYRTLREIS